MAPEPATEIKQSVTRAQTKTVVVNGQHQIVPCSAGMLVEHRPILIHGALRRVTPRPLIDDPLTALVADPRPQFRVVERLANR